MPERNLTLDTIMSEAASKRYTKEMAKALYQQWMDVVDSEDVSNLYARYKGVTFKRLKTDTKTAAFFKATDDLLNITASFDTLDSELYNEYTPEDYRQQEQERKLPIIPISAALLYISRVLQTRMKPVAEFNTIGDKTTRFLTTIANKGGQDIIDKIPGIDKKIKFRLSKQEYRDQIQQRVNVLLGNLDDTSRNQLIRKVTDGLAQNITKEQMIGELRTWGKKMSDFRAERIARTETQAAFEFMKYETAKLNGVKYKVWKTLGPRVCPTCKPLDGIVKKMDEFYKSNDFVGLTPPVHPFCECAVYYFDSKLKNWLCSKFIVKDVQKNQLYPEINTITDTELDSCVNPNAAWAGGESLVGNDKSIGTFYQELKNLKKSDPKFEEKLAYYSAQLSDEGTVQLTKKLGLRKAVRDFNTSLTGTARTFSAKLTAEEALLEKASFRYIDRNANTILKAYTKKYGKFINVDDMREFIPWNATGKAHIIHEAVSELGKVLNQRKFETLKKGDTVSFLAGGPGSGKTSAAGTIFPFQKNRYVIDGTLSNYDKAIKQIDAMIEKGIEPQIKYVMRDIDDAWFNGVIPRATRSAQSTGVGRTVPLKVFLSGTEGSYTTIAKLLTSEKYKEYVYLVDNTLGYNKQAEMMLDKFTSAKMINLQKTNYERLKKKTTELYKQGKISEEIYRGLLPD